MKHNIVPQWSLWQQSGRWRYHETQVRAFAELVLGTKSGLPACKRIDFGPGPKGLPVVDIEGRLLGVIRQKEMLAAHLGKPLTSVPEPRAYSTYVVAPDDAGAPYVGRNSLPPGDEPTSTFSYQMSASRMPDTLSVPLTSVPM